MIGAKNSSSPGDLRKRGRIHDGGYPNRTNSPQAARVQPMNIRESGGRGAAPAPVKTAGRRESLHPADYWVTETG
ncbi:hypothetical protein ASZ90_011043 [hydrocarbon metagenome]|uniref:Uncharacterized protein n=1 Tax=hydrocarbon metagenome TaxID=938273 RepID=A0A0W8FG25_9ZZZZ